jgi:hypothetical protein
LVITRVSHSVVTLLSKPSGILTSST